MWETRVRSLGWEDPLEKEMEAHASTIAWKGYREVVMDYTTDSHTVWKDDNGRIIDMHCFEYVEDGILYDGYIFPSETFSGKGKIGNIEVSCINPEAQVQFHLGYIRNNADRLFFRYHLSRQYGYRSYSPLQLLCIPSR